MHLNIYHHTYTVSAITQVRLLYIKAVRRPVILSLKSGILLTKYGQYIQMLLTHCVSQQCLDLSLAVFPGTVK